VTLKTVAFLTDNVIANIVVVNKDDHYDEFIQSIMKDEHHSYLTEDMADLTHATIGAFYDGTDVRPMQPFPSWGWNPETKSWEPPANAVHPHDDGTHDVSVIVKWNEEKQTWLPVDVESVGDQPTA